MILTQAHNEFPLDTLLTPKFPLEGPIKVYLFIFIIIVQLNYMLQNVADAFLFIQHWMFAIGKYIKNVQSVCTNDEIEALTAVQM